MQIAVKNTLPSLAKSISAGTIWKYRQATAAKRCLPDLIIVGAQKSGTTSLYAYLKRHPQIVPAFKKEVHFFDGGLSPDENSYNKGEMWYRSHFPLRTKVNANQITFEASPLYLFNPLAAQRLASLVPATKIIVLLRSPTERAISHYFHERRKKREPLTIGEAMQAEEARLQPAVKARDYKNEAFIRYSYKTRGLYCEQLKRYFLSFPQQQLLVMSAEYLFNEPIHCLRRVYSFVGVDPEFQAADFKPKNTGSNREKVPSDVYRYLERFFEAPNRDLFRMLGQTFDW